MFNDAYEDSVTNSACINDLCNLILGEGLFCQNGLNVDAILNKNDLRLIALDFKIQGQASVQVIYYDQKPIKIYHVPIKNIGLSLERKVKLNGYFYCYDWKNKHEFKPIFLNKFNEENFENETQIMVIKRPSNEPLFAKPSWYSALRWCQDEGLLAQHSYRDVKNGFSGQKVINWVGGAMLTDEQKQKVREEMKQNFTGIEGNANIFSMNNIAENSVVVDNIDPPNVNSSYVNYTEEAERKILIAHSYPAILLAGSKTGFSSNADEIVVATKSVYRRVISPDREVLINGLETIFKAINPNFKLFFKDFEEVQVKNAKNE